MSKTDRARVFTPVTMHAITSGKVVLNNYAIPTVLCLLLNFYCSPAFADLQRGGQLGIN